MVVAASLRNGTAVARQLIEAGFGTPERPIVVIASGERWPSDDTLRPALEDLLGAGLVLSYLRAAGCSLSIEASVAAASYESTGDIESTIRDCASGRELIEDGFSGDVAVASAVDADMVVPTLVDGAFISTNTAGA
jgi:2-phosphosulfolactate phosphatase